MLCEVIIQFQIAREQHLISPQLVFDQIVEEYAKEDDIYRGKIKVSWFDFLEKQEE